MSILKQHSNSRNGLIGVPKKRSPPLWWRIIFWPKAIGIHKVPKHLQSAGMYCPICRKGQPFSEQCTFCGCSFSCFVIMKSDTLPPKKRHSNWVASPATAKQGTLHRFLSPLRSSFIRFSKASLRVRVTALFVMLLLLIALIVGIAQYRSSMQKNYAQKYVVALYGINSGMNLTGMVFEGKYKAWKDGVSLEISAASDIDSETIADLVGVKAYVDETRGKMNAPPSEYYQAELILQHLYLIYEKMNSLITNSPEDLSQHKAEIATAREEFSQEIDRLKKSLPTPLVEEFKKAGQKYDLRFMTME